MNEQIENAKRVLTDAASNPKVAAVIGVGSASAGGASQMSIITGWFADLGVIVGALTTTVVFVIQLLKLYRELGIRKKSRK